ncbi:MAG: diaminopimelate epimerase [Lachnospiraceae bacterium]|jgi:diaminopimelate epimerase|nr:diaminopimelate epimerase [Lachnospiraceae bacterium]
MKFTKMQGCGNDYVYINCFEEKVEDAPALARKVSDRHFGIGADGLVLIKPSSRDDFTMEMYNADGSQGKMCGNAIRCVGKYVFDHRMTKKRELAVETLAGTKYLSLNVSGDKVSEVTVLMGVPVFEPEKIPVVAEGKSVVDMPVTVDGRKYRITAVSMGNPHAVIFVEDTKNFPIEKIGPLFERHEMFPERVNTEFVKVLDRENISMRVWERGSGETWACGTGACASAVASVINGYTDGKVTVHMLGGNLHIRYDGEGGQVHMTGPAVEVFRGEL